MRPKKEDVPALVEQVVQVESAPFARALAVSAVGGIILVTELTC